MKPGYVRCPLCKRPVKLMRNGLMPPHLANFGKVGAGFHGLGNNCRGGLKRPQDVEES